MICSPSEDGLHGGEAEALDEVLQVAGVGAVRGPGEPEVTAGQELDAAPVHLARASVLASSSFL